MIYCVLFYLVELIFTFTNFVLYFVFLGFSLTSLELTNYINIGDEGMQSIGQIIT